VAEVSRIASLCTILEAGFSATLTDIQVFSFSDGFQVLRNPTSAHWPGVTFEKEFEINKI
jgi:hypothetical protein